MLKLKLVEYPKNNNWYFDLVDEFNGKSWNGRTFQSIEEAIDFVENNNVDADLVSMHNFKYEIETR